MDDFFEPTGDGRRTTQIGVLRCVECTTGWDPDDPREWRLGILDDERRGVLYCEACAAREFGDAPGR